MRQLLSDIEKLGCGCHTRAPKPNRLRLSHQGNQTNLRVLCVGVQRRESGEPWDGAGQLRIEKGTVKKETRKVYLNQRERERERERERDREIWRGGVCVIESEREREIEREGEIGVISIRST